MLNKNSFDNKNISIHFRDRDDFLQEFKKQSSYKNGSFISTPKMIYPMGKRWNYLHNLNKLYQSKIQEKREQQRLLTEEKEMKECTFVPHLNKNISYIINNSKSANINENSKVTNKGDNNRSSFLNLNLIQRQTEWIKKKKSDIKEFENRKHRYEMEECFFSPEINGENAINKAKLKRKTISLLEDPESYSMYLKRLKKKREQVEKDKKKERLKPGNGNVWKKYSREKNKSSNYWIYGRSSQLSRSKSNARQNKYNYKNLSYLNTEYSLGNLSKKINNGEVDKSKLYEDIYKKNVIKLKDPYGKGIENSVYNKLNNNNNNNISNISENKEDDFIYNRPIEYGKAIDLLHNKLYSINLEQDENEYF